MQENEKWKVKSLSRVRLLAAPPSMGFSRQEYWSGVLSPSPIVTPVLVINISLSLLLLLLIVLICTFWKQKVKEFLSCSLRYLPGISEDTFTDATTKISVCHLQCLLQILLSAAKPSLAGYCFDMICYEICLQSSLLVSSWKTKFLLWKMSSIQESRTIQWICIYPSPVTAII